MKTTKGRKIEGTAKVIESGSRQLSPLYPFETEYQVIELDDGSRYRWTSDDASWKIRAAVQAGDTGNYTFHIRAFVRENGRINDLYKVTVSATR